MRTTSSVIICIIVASSISASRVPSAVNTLPVSHPAAAASLATPNIEPASKAQTVARLDSIGHSSSIPASSAVTTARAQLHSLHGSRANPDKLSLLESGTLPDEKAGGALLEQHDLEAFGSILQQDPGELNLEEVGVHVAPDHLQEIANALFCLLFCIP